MICQRCGKKYGPGGIIGFLSSDIAGGTDPPCPECEEKEQRRVKEFEDRARRVILTTLNHVEDHRVVEYLGIESVEVVMGTGPFSEFTGQLADMLGRRSTAFELQIQQAKQTSMLLLQHRAAKKEGNAVIGVDLDYTEFSGNRIGLIP
jgi:uncharacterized protein YbjQ (UPF0145 family)